MKQYSLKARLIFPPSFFRFLNENNFLYFIAKLNLLVLELFKNDKADNNYFSSFTFLRNLLLSL
jgi:hypothetical protein